MGSFKCIIFDFDGTLADTNTGIVNTFQETFRTMGMAVPSVERISSTIGLTLKDGFHAAYDDLSEEDAVRATVIYRELFPKIAYPVISTFPGVLQVLSQLRDKGLRLAIATSRSHKSLGHLTEQLGVAPYFEAFYAAEDVVNHKPAPDLVNLVLKDFGLSPDDALVVGDATFDLLMGKGASCKVCGVTWGNQNRELLQTASPDYLIDRIEDLLEII